MHSKAPAPLSGVRILSVEQYGSAPYATLFAASLGADVIKVENATIGGDPARRTGPFMLGDNDSEYFQCWNYNKRSVALDLKSAADRARFEQLVRDADVVANNLRGDQPAALGLDYATLSVLNPRVVCLHVSAYGRDNDRADWPGYDYLMQAETGLMALTGEPDAPPTRYGAPSPVDQVTGLTAAVGLLAALLQARSTGVGCDVDTCLFDAALHQTGYTAVWYLNHGYLPARTTRSAHFSLTPVQTYPTADGWIFVMCMTQKFWLALLQAMGREDLALRDEFRSSADRSANHAALDTILDAEFRARSTADWIAVLGGKLPVAPVQTLGQALDSEFVRTAGLICEAPHPANPDFRVLANPLKFNGQRVALSVCSPMGADNDTWR